MKRVVCFLLIITACKSSLKPSEERNSMTAVTQKMLNELLTVAYYPENFNGDIEHISELYTGEVRAGDGYVRKDTVYREYWFTDGRLVKIASTTRRMLNDTLTIRYDDAGRITELASSDARKVYNRDQLKYDTSGRRIEKKNQVYNTANIEVYGYCRTGDTVLIRPGKGGMTDSLYCTRMEDHIIITYITNGEKILYDYDRDAQLVERTIYGENNSALSKATSKYDSKGNIVWREFRQGDGKPNGKFELVRNTVNFEYTYDSQGNWTFRKEDGRDGNRRVTKRNITYR